MHLSTADAERIAGIAARPRVREALAWVARSGDVLAAETVRVTEIPAPTFGEHRRAAYVAERLCGLGLVGVEIGADGNVYSLLAAEGEQRPALAAYAHLDTVFAEGVPVTVERRDGRLYAPGVGDNSAGVAGLVCALAAMQAAGLRPARPVSIVGTVGEEGLGDLCGAHAASERLAGTVEVVVAVEGSFFGRVSHTAVGSRRLRVRMEGGGGHSWHDFGRPSAVHALARAAAAIAQLAVPTEPRTSYNIGEIRGGTGVNVIAECAEMVVDLRSVNPGTLDKLERRVRRIIEEEEGRGVRVDVRTVGDRPAGSIAVGHPLVRTCTAVLGHLGMSPQYAAASTDANAALGRGIPAVTLGVTRGGGAHTLGEWIELAPMVRGVQQLVLVLCALAEPAAGS